MSMARVTCERKLKVWERDGWRCAYCGCEVVRNPPGDCLAAPNMATVDHAQSRRNGGVNAQTNLVTCCFACNQMKGDRSVRRFERRLRKLGENGQMPNKQRAENGR